MCPGKVLPKENESLEDTMNIAREKIRTKRGSKAYLARRGKEIHNVEGGGEIDPWSIVRGVEKVRETQTTEGVARDITPALPIPSLHTRTPTTLTGWLSHSSLPEELGCHSLPLLPLSVLLPSKNVFQLYQEGGKEEQIMTYLSRTICKIIKFITS